MACAHGTDLTHRRGGYGWPDFGDSTIMGLEIASDVIAVGDRIIPRSHYALMPDVAC